MNLTALAIVIAMLAAAPAPAETGSQDHGYVENSLQDLRTSDETGYCLTIHQNESSTLWDHIKWDDDEWVLLAGPAVRSIPAAEGSAGLLLHGEDGATQFHKVEDPALKLIAERLGATVQLPRIVAIPLGPTPSLPCKPSSSPAPNTNDPGAVSDQ
jgi:hypothetical protein